MSDLERAKALLDSHSDYTCVLCRENQVYKSRLRGIRPLLQFVSEGTPLKGFSAADRIVGKAAAMLFVLAEVKEVFAPVMSAGAIEAFRKYEISASCNQCVQTIVNRSGSGPCPMELAVAQISDPQEALHAVRETAERLARRQEP